MQCCLKSLSHKALSEKGTTVSVCRHIPKHSIVCGFSFGWLAGWLVGGLIWFSILLKSKEMSTPSHGYIPENTGVFPSESAVNLDVERAWLMSHFLSRS